RRGGVARLCDGYRSLPTAPRACHARRTALTVRCRALASPTREVDAVSCARFDADLVDRARGAPLSGERGAALERHLRECTPCGMRLEREQALSAALRRLLEDTITPSVDPVQAQELLAAFDTRWSRVPPRIYAWHACAGALLVVAATLMWIVASRARPSDPHPTPASMTDSSSTDARLAAEVTAPEAHSTHVAKGARPRRPNAARPVEHD